MAWIESHQELARHPKTRRLARALEEPLVTVVGRLHFLWWWALDFAQDGHLESYDYADIADAMLWEGEPRRLWDALVGAGFIDSEEDGDTARLHDWHDYAGRLIERREANAERMRAARAKPVPDTKTPRAAHVQRTLHARAGATVPNRTVPEPDLTGPETKTGDDARTAAAVAPPAVGKRMTATKGPSLAPLVDAFRERGLPDPILDGPEARYAQQLLKHHPPGEVAACWQEIAACEYGDEYMRRKLGFKLLATDNLVPNWQAWKRAPPAARNGPARLPNQRTCTRCQQPYSAPKVEAAAFAGLCADCRQGSERYTEGKYAAFLRR